MAIITLTTDFGEKDYFVGAVKGRICTEMNAMTVVDISHRISPFNIQEGAYILKNTYKNFPEGTVHIIGIDSERTPENRHLVMLLDGHYFIGADNGIFSLLASDMRPERLAAIGIDDTPESSFPVLDVFVKAACHIARGGKPELLGKPVDSFKEIKALEPVVNAEKDKITGHVIYIDNYGNVVTNITRTLFEAVGKGRDFELSARNYTFRSIYKRYSEAIDFSVEKHRRQDDGKKMAIFNSGGHVELAIYKSNLDTVGGAATLLGLDYRDTVTVQFG
ncbi:MAG: SAM-dependent chlorinase/fluorinase [Sinomicrobium sp.]|nr:SAM-dependent chlorinase/fluorinase [Sinomicrobium sp.]